MPWRVQEVAVLPGYRLFVRFLDGLSGTVDLAGMIASPYAGVSASPSDEALFRQVLLAHGAVTSPNDLDLGSDAMHAEIAAHGEWIVA